MTKRALERLRILGLNLMTIGVVTIGFGLAWQQETRIVVGGAVAAVGVRLWFTEPIDKETEAP